MRDNLPNYLNMHNIDPGRVVAARIDTPPGNDSIRPGRSKVVKITREEAANILDLKTRPEALADFVGPELAGIVHQAMIMGAEALRSRWVKTADRLPTEADADELGRVLLMCVVDKWCNYVPVSTIDADEEWFWMPIPPLQGEV